MLVPELLRHLEIKNVSAKSDIVFNVELHFFSLSLVEGLIGGVSSPTFNYIILYVGVFCTFLTD